MAHVSHFMAPTAPSKKAKPGPKQSILSFTGARKPSPASTSRSNPISKARFIQLNFSHLLSVIQLLRSFYHQPSHLLSPQASRAPRSPMLCPLIALQGTWHLLTRRNTNFGLRNMLPTPKYVLFVHLIDQDTEHHSPNWSSGRPGCT